MALAGSDHFVANNVIQALSRSLDRVFEDAQLSGILSLSGRNLKEFPSAAGRYDLTDTVVADLSRNRLIEFPVQLCEYGSLETLILYHNSIRSIPIAVQFLASLSYLDLSRNQLVSIPSALTLLPLEVLILNNNRIQSVPSEICRLGGTLMELDISCNRLTSLPLEVGDLGKLRVLNARENLLSELPLTLNKVRLRTLDVSSNKLSFLDVSIRGMVSLIELNVDNNPLVFPSAKLCDRGCVHIFKSLELESTRRSKRRPQTANSVETADVLDRRRYRMATAAAAAAAEAALNGNDPKMIPMNSVDYKYMSLSTMEHRRKYRHRTIASETRYPYSSSIDDSCGQYSAMPNERPIDNVDRPTVGPILQKRSPPVGEEVPPPPPRIVEATPPLLAARQYAANSRSPRSDKLIDGSSLVDEVMAACRETEIETKKMVQISNSSTAAGGVSVDGANGMSRKQEQDAIRRSNGKEYQRHENGVANSRNLDLNSNISSVSVTTPASAYDSMKIRSAVSPASSNSSSTRQSQRATYAIKEERELSPPCALTATCSSHLNSPDSRTTDGRRSKSPPKSARSDVIQSIYTASTGSSPNAKKMLHNRSDQANVHLCCPSHSGQENVPMQMATKNGHDQQNSTVINMKSKNVTDGKGNPPKVDAGRRDSVEKGPKRSISRESQLSNEPEMGSNKNGPPKHAPTGGRQDVTRRSSGPTGDAAKAQKKMPGSVNGVRASTSSQLQKGPSQSSLTPSMSSQRLNSMTTSTKTSPGQMGTGSAANGATGAVTASASKKLSPPHQEPMKTVPTSVKTVPGQKTENVGPVFNRASMAANQSRASRSRESLSNGVTSNGGNSRKGELSDRNQQLIEDMRQVLEKTLKISLPSNMSDLAESLSDGIHLCSFVNAVRPRTIPSVHLPTDTATKLPAAKCRRNVENFLMGCRRLGVSESQLFNVSDVSDKKTLTSAARAILALLKQAVASNSASSINGIKLPPGVAGYAKMTNV